jgi:hypothetical protein
MTEAMRDALALIRSLKEQYPDETEDQLISRFQKELEGDQTLKRALMRDVFKGVASRIRQGVASRIRRREAAELKGIGRRPFSAQVTAATAPARV